MKEINVEYAEGTCKKCAEKRPIYYLSGFLYGQRLLLTEDGKYYLYLNCFEDAVFNEVEAIFQKLIINKKLTQDEETNYFNKVFGISCDNINGSKVDAHRVKVACLKCGSSDFDIMEGNPPTIAKVKIPEITHLDWSRLLQNDKEALILNELQEKGCI